MKIKVFFKKNIFRGHLTKKPESGRSMIEMLGVLAIIGLLSAGAIGGFKYALDFWEARNIQTIVTQSKVLAVTKQARQRVNDDGTFRNTGLTRFLRRTPLKGYAENANAMLEIKQGTSERDYIYLIHLETVSFNVQKFIWRDKEKFAEIGIAINPTQELINEFEEEDGQTIQTKESWILYGMNADTADRLEPELGIESNEKITFLFNVTRRVGGEREEITPPGPEDEYCAMYDCDCKGQPLPYYENGVVIECEAGKYYDGTLERCIPCDLPECTVGTTAERAEDCYEWEEFVEGCCIKKNNPSSSDSSDTPDSSDPNVNCPPEKPYYDEETGKCVSRCKRGKTFLSDWKACISCNYNGAVTIDDTAEGRGYCTECILTTGESRQIKKNPKNETYCVYNSCTPGLEIQLKSGECQICSPGLHQINIGEQALGSETLCRACGGEVLTSGLCRIPCPAGQYMDVNGQCHGCDECTGYEVGTYNGIRHTTINEDNPPVTTEEFTEVEDLYYQENCLACGNKEIETIRRYSGKISTYKTFCKNKGQFGWFSYSSSDIFMCKTCADIPENGVRGLFITQEDCEMCGGLQTDGGNHVLGPLNSGFICCPKNTFYSSITGKCHPCDTPGSIRMYKYVEVDNCEKFCGDQRVLRIRSRWGDCLLKKQCAEGELYDIDENKCYACNANKVSIYVGTGTDAMRDCTACSNREYQNGYCVLACLDNQYRDLAGNCHDCNECTGYRVSTSDASTCTTACTNRKIEEGGLCVLKKMPTGKYMSQFGQCYSCEECKEWYTVGGDTSENAYYRESCLACGNKEINSIGVCKDKGRFGWIATCRACSDLPKSGISGIYIAKEDCEMCGLWEGHNICCPKNTFYSDPTMKCHACDTPDSIQMWSSDAPNCETFCGNRRVLANRNGTYYCELKKQCGTGELYDIDENKCYACDSDKVSIHVGTEGNAMRNCTVCGNRLYKNGYCVQVCPNNQYRDSEGNCHDCDECARYNASETDASTCTESCTNRKIKDGYCVLKDMTGKYMDKNGQCHSCSECTGYEVGYDNASYTYYRESCLACGNKEIKKIVANWDTYDHKHYCVDRGQFGWQVSSTSSSEFMCKACSDIPEAGIDGNDISKEVCEICGWWYGDICCPKNTFYSRDSKTCRSCDTPDSVPMDKYYDASNCKRFCGDKRVLAKRSDIYYCELKKQCAEGEIRNSETNTCHGCSEAVNIPINGDDTVRNWCLKCRGRRVEVDGATGAENCVLGSCSANGGGDSQFVGSNGQCYTCDYPSRVPINTPDADMQSTLQDLCKGSDSCGRVITKIGYAVYCDPKCVSGEEYRDETGYCSTCSGLTPDNSPMTDSAESRALCTACGGTPGTPEGLTGLYCIKSAQ